MGQAALIVFLILAILVALFAVQNAGPVTLRFGFWSVETSLVVVNLAAAAAGTAVASLLCFPGWTRERSRFSTVDAGAGQAPRTQKPAPAAPPAPFPRLLA